MNVDAAAIIGLIIILGGCVLGLVGYIKSQNNELKALLMKSLDECESGRKACEARSASQQAQIDALIDGDNDLAKSKRDTDTVPIVHQPAVITDPTPRARKLLGLLLVMVSVCLMCGCGRPLSDGQLAQLAQARADAIASRATTDESAEVALLRASVARQMAAVADLELPEPMTPASVLVTPDGTPNDAAIAAEQQAATAAEKDPPKGWMSGTIAWVGGAGLLILAGLRCSPGLFGVVANVAHQFLAPLATRQMRQRQQQAGQIAEQAIAYGSAITAAAKKAGLDEQVEDLQVAAAKVQDHLGIREQIKAIMTEMKSEHGTASPRTGV